MTVKSCPVITDLHPHYCKNLTTCSLVKNIKCWWFSKSTTFCPNQNLCFLFKAISHFLKVGRFKCLLTPQGFKWAHLICASVCMHTYVFVYVVAHTCTASMHVCVFFILSTPCHLPPSLPPSLCCLLPSLSQPCSWERQARSQKCKCAAWLMSHREAAFPSLFVNMWLP